MASTHPRNENLAATEAPRRRVFTPPQTHRNNRAMKLDETPFVYEPPSEAQRVADLRSRTRFSVDAQSNLSLRSACRPPCMHREWPNHPTLLPPLLCDSAMMAPSHPRRLFVSLYKNHMLHFSRLLSKKLKLLLRALSRTRATNDFYNDVVFEVGQYLTTNNYAFGSSYVSWISYVRKRWHAQRQSHQVPLTIEQFLDHYLRPFLEELDCLTWDASLRLHQDARPILSLIHPYCHRQSTRTICEAMVRTYEALESFELFSVFFEHQQICAISQMDAPEWLKDVIKKKGQKKEPRVSPQERERQRKTTQRLNKARAQKMLRNSNNDSAVLESQMNRANSSPYSPFGEPTQNPPPPPQEPSAEFMADVEDLLNLNNPDLNAAFDAYIRAENDDIFHDAPEEEPDDAPSLIAKLLGVLTSAKQSVKTTAEWMAEHMISLHTFFGRICTVVSAGFRAANSLLTWFADGQDILYIPRLLVLFLIYLVGYACNCADISRVVAAFYAIWAFDGVLSWVPAVIAFANMRSSQLASQAGDGSEFLSSPVITTSVSLLAASLFGKLASFTSAPRRDGFFATMDSISRGINGTINVSEKITILFRKAVGYFGLEEFGFAPDLESALPTDFEALLADVEYFSNAEVVRAFNRTPSDCIRAENMRKELLLQLNKYARVPTLRTRLQAFSPFVHRVADVAALRNPVHSKIRTEPVCVFLYGASGIGKSVAMNLIAAAVLAANGYIPAGSSASVVSKVLAEQFYVRNGQEDFWSGYHNQFIAGEDDALQVKDSENNPSNHPGEFIGISNSFVYPLNMPELQDKGTTYFQSAVYLASTNLAIINPPSIVSQEAYLRRITIPLQVTIDPSKADENGRIKKTPNGAFDPSVYRFQYHDFKTGLPEGHPEKPHYLTLKEVCDHINLLIKKKADQSAQLEDACTSFSRLFSQSGRRSLITSGDLEYTVSESTLKWLQTRVNCNTEYFPTLNAIALECDAGNLPEPPELVTKVYNCLLKGSTSKTCIYTYDTFDPKEHLSLLVSCRKWIASVKAKFSSWIATVRWTQILKYIGYATALFSVAATVTNYGVNRYHKSTVPVATTEQERTFDKVSSLEGGFFRSSPKNAHAFTSGTTHIPYRYDRPTPFSHFSENFTLSCFSSQEEQDDFYAARDLFTLEHGDDDTKEKLSPEDYLPRTFGLSWAKPDALIARGILNWRDIAVYKSHLAVWNANGEAISQSGKARGKTQLKKAAPRPALRSHIGNSNADEVWKKVSQNQGTLSQGTWNNHVLFFAGRKFLFNYHAFRAFSEMADKNPFVTLYHPGASVGVQVQFSRISWTKISERFSDVIIGEMPRDVCKEYPNIVHFFIKREDVQNLVHKKAIISVPGPNHFQLATGTVRKIDNEEIQDKLGAYTAYGATLNIATKQGYCGSPYILDSADCRRIFAIHTAGVSGVERSVGSLVFQDMLQVVSQMGDETEPLLSGNVLDLGTLPPVFANTKTQIVPTQIFGQVCETTMAPAKLAAFNTPGGPMAKALKKQFGPVYALDEDILHHASKDYTEFLQNVSAPPEELGVLSFERATRGDEGSDYIRPINRSRSAGYPFVLETKQKGKTEWFGSTEWVENDKTAALKQRCHDQISEMEQGKSQVYVFLDVLKDETRPLEKVAEGKTRVFAAAPMDFIIVFRMYFLTFLAWMMRNRIANESAVGIRAQSNEWTLLYQKLSEKGPRVIAGDFSNYDGSLGSRMLWAVYDIIDSFYEAAGQTPAERNVRYCLWRSIVNSHHLCGNVFYQLNHSQPSGNPATAILNSMYNSLACRYVFYRIYDPATVRFSDVVSMCAYGDDDVLNVSDLVPAFNQESMAAEFALIGMTYTDEDKSGRLGDKTLDKVSFLKRKFVYVEEDRYCYAPLALPSILECFNWTKKTDYELDIMIQNARSAFVELAMHPEGDFKYWSYRIARALKDGYQTVCAPTTNWSGYRLDIRSGFAIATVAELDWS